MECATVFSEGDCCYEDPTTQRIAQLQSRIQEQSDLIALLTEQSERSSVCPEPAESSSRIQEELLLEHERANALDKRFAELADKFEQITQIKDSYKDQVKSLELVFRQNTERQHEAVRPLIQAKDDQIDNLKKRVCILERERAELVARASLLEYDNDAKWKEVTAHRHSLEEQLQEKSAKCNALSDSNAEIESELQTLRKEFSKLEAAYTRSEDLRAEIAFRGRALCAKDRIIAALRSEIEEWRDRLAGVYRQYHEFCVTVSSEELPVKRSIKPSRCKLVPQHWGLTSVELATKFKPKRPRS